MLQELGSQNVAKSRAEDYVPKRITPDAWLHKDPITLPKEIQSKLLRISWTQVIGSITGPTGAVVVVAGRSDAGC